MTPTDDRAHELKLEAKMREACASELEAALSTPPTSPEVVAPDTTVPKR